MMAMSALPMFRPPQIADKRCDAPPLDGGATRGACVSAAALMQQDRGGR
jgi:hypothetical protein